MKFAVTGAMRRLSVISGDRVRDLLVKWVWK